MFEESVSSTTSVVLYLTYEELTLTTILKC